MSDEVAVDVDVKDHATCGRCHRALKNAASRKIGFGPVCLKKIGSIGGSNHVLKEYGEGESVGVAN